MNRWKYVLVGLLVGAFAFPLVWNSDPLVIGQTVTVDSTQSPLVVNALADLANLTPTDGQSVIIKTGTEKGLWYYDKDSATATGVSVLNGPGSVGRFLVINNDAGSVAAATAITAAEITDDGLLELQAFDGSSAKSLTLAELKKTGVQVVNVVQLGADPLGVADSSDAFQDAIAILAVDDVSASKPGVIYAPRGKYRITETIDFGTLRGWQLVGDGADSIPTATVTYKSAATRIFWDGADSGVLMRTDGAHFRIQDIGFFGVELPKASSAASANRCGTGFILGYAGGIGSGNAVVDNVRWHDFDIAWQNGDVVGDGNCGDMVFRSVEFSYCGVGMRTVNTQGLNYVFDYLQSTVVDKLFQFDEGGGLYVGMLHTLVTPIVLEIDNVGAETGGFTFGFVKFDANQGGVTPRLLNMTDTSIISAPKIVFQSIRAPAAMFDDATSMFRVVGNASLVVSDCTFLHPDTTIVELETGTAGFYPSAIFEKCMIDAADAYPPVSGWDDVASFVSVIDTANAKTFTANNATETMSWASANYDTFFNGEKVRVSSTGTLPTGLSATTDYYIVERDWAGLNYTDFKLSETRGGAAVSFTTDGTGTLKVRNVSADNTNVRWEFRDCTTNGLNIPLPTIGIKKTTYDYAEAVVNMRGKSQLDLEYTTAGTMNFITNNESSSGVEVHCNANASLSSATGANRLLLSGSAGFAADAQGATFVFRRRGDQWYEVSRTVY